MHFWFGACCRTFPKGIGRVPPIGTCGTGRPRLFPEAPRKGEIHLTLRLVSFCARPRGTQRLLPSIYLSPRTVKRQVEVGLWWEMGGGMGGGKCGVP